MAPDSELSKLQPQGEETQGEITRQHRTKLKFGFVIRRTVLFSAALLLFLILLFHGRMPSVAEWQGLVQVGAILTAGIWSYFLFVRGREDYPVVELDLSFQHWSIDQELAALRLEVKMHNKSSVLVPLQSAKIHVRQVQPITPDLRELIGAISAEDKREGTDVRVFGPNRSTIQWRTVGYRDLSWPEGSAALEPGETDRFIYDFILSGETEAVEVVYNLDNEAAGTPDCWARQAIYVLGGNMTEKLKTSDAETSRSENAASEKPKRITESQSRQERTPNLVQEDSGDKSSRIERIVRRPDPGEQKGQPRHPRTPNAPPAEPQSGDAQQATQPKKTEG